MCREKKKLKKPEIHLTADSGWMNDPNGFSYYKGQYHMFYQYHPFSSIWGPMHWGHAVSKDLIHWSYLPVALVPDMKYDKDGCFSGNAISLSDEKQVLIYTGVKNEIQTDGSVKGVQTQCLAIGDGITYEKNKDNPVITEMDIPNGFSRYDFRDPTIWKKKDGTYCSLVANRAPNGSGQVLLFKSKDIFKWKYEKVFIKNDFRYGTMWECPDFFELDNNAVFVVSPMDIKEENAEGYNGNGTLCLIGSYDEDADVFDEKSGHLIDYGIDFYAPQTVEAPDGRKIMIGWMQNWDSCNLRVDETDWYGQMSVPRELSIQNNRLIQWPIQELDDLRCNKVEYKNIVFTGEKRFDGIYGRIVDLEIQIESEDSQKLFEIFELRFAQNDVHYTSLKYLPGHNKVEINRELSGYERAIINKRHCKVKNQSGHIKFRIIMDRYSVEVFINDGEQVMTSTIYTEQDARDISFIVQGNIKMHIVKYDLKA